LEADIPLLEVATAVGVALGVRDRGLEPVELRLARGQIELSAVELGLTGDRLARDLAAVGQLPLEPLGVVAELLLLEQEVALAVADRLVTGGEASRVLLQVAL